MKLNGKEVKPGDVLIYNRTGDKAIVEENKAYGMLAFVGGMGCVIREGLVSWPDEPESTPDTLPSKSDH